MKKIILAMSVLSIVATGATAEHKHNTAKEFRELFNPKPVVKKIIKWLRANE